MKIVDRKTFLAMPPETLFSKYQPFVVPSVTLFSKYQPCVFDDLLIKGESIDHGPNRAGDFLYQSIADALECSGTDELATMLKEAETNGSSIGMDFDCQGRDGCFEEDQLFAVWERADVEALIERLVACIK